MIRRLLCASISCLLSACGAPSEPVPAPVTPGPPAQTPLLASMPVVPAAFVPLGPPRAMAPVELAPGPKCAVTEHVLGPLADPKDNLAPVDVVADAQGALAGWLGAAGLTLQRLGADGVPAGPPITVPGTWRYVPRLLLSAAEVALVSVTPTEIATLRFERASLRLLLAEKRFPRPPGLGDLLDAALDGPDLWIIGSRDKDLLFLRVGPDGLPRTAVMPLPERMPADPLVTVGRKDGNVAVLISTLGGDAWLAGAFGVHDAAAGEVAPSPGRFVRPMPLELRTGATPYGLQIVPGYPLSRANDARLAEEKPPEAFQTRGTYGFPSMAWTGTHFLSGEVQGPWEEGKMDKLSAVVSAVDCRAR